MSMMKSQDYLARIYEKGGSTPLPISIRLEGGEVVAYDESGRSSTFPMDDWELKLGGTREDRVVLKSHTTGETIIADIKLLDALAAGTRYPLLTKQAKKLKGSSFARFIGQSSGVIFLAVIALALVGWIALGIAGSRLEGPAHGNRDGNNTAATEEKQDQSEPGTIDTAHMPTDQYMSMVQKRIKHNWHPHFHKAATAIVIFELQRDGSISKARLQESTGSANLDKLALDAVEKSSPLPPLPEQIQDPAEVKFTLQVTTNKAHHPTQDQEE